MPLPDLSAPRWRLRMREVAIALAGAVLGFAGVYVARLPRRVAPASVTVASAVAPRRRLALPPPAGDAPKALLAAPAVPAPPRQQKANRHRRRPASADTAAALARAYAEDALTTRRLNEAAMARLAPAR